MQVYTGFRHRILKRPVILVPGTLQPAVGLHVVGEEGQGSLPREIAGLNNTATLRVIRIGCATGDFMEKVPSATCVH